MTNRKPNWIKACEDTQKKLIKYLENMDTSWFEVEVEGVENVDNCSFCEQAGDDGCEICIVFEACHERESFTSNKHDRDYRISEIHKCHAYLEDLKGMLRRGEI
jgi:hypothetical protein